MKTFIDKPLKKCELGIIMAPSVNLKPVFIFYNPEIDKAITEKGQCLIHEMIQKMKDNGFGEYVEGMDAK